MRHSAVIGHSGALWRPRANPAPVDVLELDQIKASYGDQSFPVALDGTSFAELVTSVRSAAVTLEAHEPVNP
jgi:hypothetical protein